MSATGGSSASRGAHADVDGKTLRADFLAATASSFALEALDRLEDVYFFVKNVDRRFVYYNRPFVKLMGRRSDELIGLRDEDISPEYLVRTYRRDDEQVLSSGTSLVNLIEIVHNRDDSYDWFTTTKFPVRDRDGAVIGVAGTTRSVHQREEPSQYLPLAAAVETILTEFHRNLSVEHLAKSVSLSTSQFHRQFKAQFGVTPHRYIRNVRLMAACNLLSTTDWPASRIASRCGYSDQSHLSHELVRAHGVSPRKYRQQFRVESFDSNLKLPVLTLD